MALDVRMALDVPSSSLGAALPALAFTPVSSRHDPGSNAEDGSPTNPLSTRMAIAAVTAVTTPRDSPLRPGLEEEQVFQLQAGTFCSINTVGEGGAKHMFAKGLSAIIICHGV